MDMNKNREVKPNVEEKTTYNENDFKLEIGEEYYFDLIKKRLDDVVDYEDPKVNT